MRRTLTALACTLLSAPVFAQDPAPTPEKPALSIPKINLPKGDLKGKIQPKPTLGGLAAGDSAGKDEPPLAPVVGKDGLIARVNGAGIPLKGFSEKYEQFSQGFQTRKRAIPRKLALRYRESLVKRMIEEELISQEAKRLNVVPTAQDLKAALDEHKKLFSSEEQFLNYLKSKNLTEQQVQETLLHNVLVKLLLQKAKVGQVTDAEVTAYYEKSKSKYEVKEQVRASHILIKLEPNATPEQVKAALDKATTAADRARKGEDFAALAKTLSEGPTAPRGGDLGLFGRGRMVKEFDETVFNMKIGAISDPVRTRFGWHVIKLIERQEGRTRPLEEVKENIQRMLESRAERQARADIIEGLRAQAKIELYLPEEPEDAPKPQLPVTPAPAAP
jgi:peptidyl-prolyl cis-trans isomerase C